MKPSGITVSFLAVLGSAGLLALAPVPVLSQAGVQLVKVDVAVVAQGYRASKLIGDAVYNDKNEKVGSLDDIVLDKNKVQMAILQVGGFLGVGGRLVAVPFDTLNINDSGKRLELPGATKDALKGLQEFRYRT